MILQPELQQQFQTMLGQRKVPHALMLVGGEGVGSFDLSIQMSKALLCPNATAGSACNQCKSCQLVGQFGHPDLHFAYPVVKHAKHNRKDTFSDHFIGEWRQFLEENENVPSLHGWLQFIGAESSRADINVKECNEIIKKLALRSHGGIGKVLILWLPEFLGNNSNRLLKIIEEPPADTTLIFLTQNPGKLLTTILSRFQKFICKPITPDNLIAYLVQHNEISKNQAEHVVPLAEGSITKALEILDGGEIVKTDKFLNWFRLSYESNPEKIVGFVNDFSKNNKSYQRNFCDFVLKMLGAMIKYPILGRFDGFELSSTEQENLLKLSKILTVDKVNQISSIMNDLLRNMDQNINVRISMMSESFKIGRILRAR